MQPCGQGWSFGTTCRGDRGAEAWSSEGLFGESNGQTKLTTPAAHEGSRWARLGLKEQQQGKVQGVPGRTGSGWSAGRTGEAHTEGLSE